MEQLTKNRKKKGFTLIELIAVIAIIGILAAVLVPRIVGYMNDAKKSKIVTQARSVVMAYERYAVTAVNPQESINKGDLASAMNSDATLQEYAADLAKADKIGTGVTVAQCRDLADGNQGKPTLDTDGVWDGTYETSSSSTSEN